MKKKIKDLTLEEIIKICEFHVCENCVLCFAKSSQTTNQVCIMKSKIEPYAWDIKENYINELNKEIEVNEDE